MKEKSLLFSAVLSLLLLLPGMVKAEVGPGEELPAVGDPFWNVMSQIDRPDDPTCTAKATVILNAAGLPGGAERAAATCQSIGWIITTMEPSLESEGVTTNLFDQTNWHSITGLYFQEESGKIEFTNSIDFMSRDFMLFLSSLVSKLDFAPEEIGLDADLVNGMRNAGTVITMWNVSDFDDPEILVDGEADEEGVVSGMSYDAATNTIIFNAAHFTTFKAVEKGSADTKRPKITKVEYQQYTSNKGKVKIKMTIKGKNLGKNAKVKLGRQYADTVKYYNSGKIQARFTLSDLLKKHKASELLTLKVKNTDDLVKKFDRKINFMLKSATLSKTN